MIYKKFREMLERGDIPAGNYFLNMLGNTPVNDDIVAIASILNTAGCSLYLEMAESMKVPESVLSDRMLKVRRNRIKLAMDDYGQSAANLETLYQVDFDIIKIPRAFVMDIDRNKKNRKFVSNIIHYCRESKIECVAEGVETMSELVTVMEMGVNYVQGFYFAKPTEKVPDYEEIFYKRA
jgi:EAL domain-containing protein (putative c-di-GMP-specific phosphodiesterase class I)